jgi:sugar/nucleoside kinase (ribokinase family)
MARIVVMGSAASDEAVLLAEPLRAGLHLNGKRAARRLGGGGANTAVALAAAGHHVQFLSEVGQDSIGDWLLRELENAGIDTAHVLRLPRPSTRSLVLVDPAGERTVVNLSRCEDEAPPARLLHIETDAIYVRSRRADLGPLLASKVSTCLIVAHVPPTAPGSRPAQVLVTSASDLEAGVADQPLDLARQVAGEPLRWTVVTHGADGARAHSANGVLAAPAESVPVVDTTGAGDAFAAGLLHGLVAGKEMADALALAVRFGTESTRWPTSALPAEAVRRLLA